MTGIRTWAIVCNGAHCREVFTFYTFPPASLTDARRFSKIQGWSNRVVNLPGPGLAPSLDFCKACTTNGKDEECVAFLKDPK